MKDWKRVAVNSSELGENIDPDNILESEVNGCKVRLFFTKEPSQMIEKGVYTGGVTPFGCKDRDCITIGDTNKLNKQYLQ